MDLIKDCVLYFSSASTNHGLNCFGLYFGLETGQMVLIANVSSPKAGKVVLSQWVAKTLLF